MADRTCEKCLRVFQFPSQLRRHEGRKTPCRTIVASAELPIPEQTKPYGCRFCGHRFAQHPSMYRHIKNSCKVAGSPEGMQKLFDHTHKKQLEAEAQLAELQRQILAGTAAATQLPAACQQNISTNQMVINQHTVNNISFNVFGNEDCSHIDKVRIKRLLDEVMSVSDNPQRGATMALLKAATMIYGDRERPENTTCYLPNAKHDKAMVHEAEGWGIRPYQTIAPSIAGRVVSLLFDLQPFADASKYESLMLALRDNEDSYKGGKELREILIRNKGIVEELRRLPHSLE